VRCDLGVEHHLTSPGYCWVARGDDLTFSEPCPCGRIAPG
jgi:hypothetical protein